MSENESYPTSKDLDYYFELDGTIHRTVIRSKNSHHNLLGLRAFVRSSVPLAEEIDFWYYDPSRRRWDCKIISPKDVYLPPGIINISRRNVHGRPQVTFYCREHDPANYVRNCIRRWCEQSALSRLGSEYGSLNGIWKSPDYTGPWFANDAGAGLDPTSFVESGPAEQLPPLKRSLVSPDQQSLISLGQGKSMANDNTVFVTSPAVAVRKACRVTVYRVKKGQIRRQLLDMIVTTLDSETARAEALLLVNHKRKKALAFSQIHVSVESVN